MKKFEITFGTNRIPHTQKVRSVVCFTAVMAGLRVEKINAFPAADMIEVGGSLDVVKRLCERVLPGVGFVEHRPEADEGQHWFDVTVSEGRGTGIVQRGNEWCFHV